jgi:hypothetical protein
VVFRAGVELKVEVVTTGEPAIGVSWEAVHQLLVSATVLDCHFGSGSGS